MYMCPHCTCTCVLTVHVHVSSLYMYMCPPYCTCTCVLTVHVHVSSLYMYMCPHCTCTCPPIIAFDLGVRVHTGQKIDNVLLPPWAKSPEEFIQKHKEALVRGGEGEGGEGKE